MACFPRSLTTATFFSTALGSDASALVCTCFFIESGVTSGRRSRSGPIDSISRDSSLGSIRRIPTAARDPIFCFVLQAGERQAARGDSLRSEGEPAFRSDPQAPRRAQQRVHAWVGKIVVAAQALLGPEEHPVAIAVEAQPPGVGIAAQLAHPAGPVEVDGPVAQGGCPHTATWRGGDVDDPAGGQAGGAIEGLEFAPAEADH